jgi:hypothetical protein
MQPIAPRRGIAGKRNATDSGSVDAGNGIWRRFDHDGFSRIKETDVLAVHRDLGRCAAAFTDLFQGAAVRIGMKRGLSRRTFRLTEDAPGSRTGRKERLLGHIGVSSNAWMDG